MLSALSSLQSRAQTPSTLLASRAELISEATRAQAAAGTGSTEQRTLNAMAAASIQQRLRDGDLQVGDRVAIAYTVDLPHRDTLVVKAGRYIELPGMAAVPVDGLLRSELYERVATEILKYVKAQQIEVTPLVRVGVLGAVARPGYFAFASDLPLTQAIMGAGGPSTVADLDRSVVRRQNREYRSAAQTRRAIAGGLTLDQFGLNAGDEVIVGQRSDLGASKLLGMAGAAASVLALFVALKR
ncbi:MAG: polysaccharide biosynthesis/export family protein [Gemmatimonadaceae bacterium]